MCIVVFFLNSSSFSYFFIFVHNFFFNWTTIHHSLHFLSLLLFSTVLAAHSFNSVLLGLYLCVALLVFFFIYFLHPFLTSSARFCRIFFFRIPFDLILIIIRLKFHNSSHERVKEYQSPKEKVTQELFFLHRRCILVY